MKKYLLSLVAVLSLVGCGNTGSCCGESSGEGMIVTGSQSGTGAGTVNNQSGDTSSATGSQGGTSVPVTGAQGGTSVPVTGAQGGTSGGTVGTGSKKDERYNLGEYLIKNRMDSNHKGVHLDILDEAAKEAFSTDLKCGKSAVSKQRLDCILNNDEEKEKLLESFKSSAQNRDSKYNDDKIFTLDYFCFCDIDEAKNGDKKVLDRNYHSNLPDSTAECGSTDVFSVVDEDGDEVTKAVMVFCALDK